MGDPAGIGPEVVAKALSHREIHSICRPLVFGTTEILNMCVSGTIHPPGAAAAKGSVREAHFVPVRKAAEAVFVKGEIAVIDMPISGRIRLGRHSAASGKAALAYIDQAVECAARGEIDAIVTAPVSKAAIRMAGISTFTGHTEYLARKTNTRSFAMMFYGEKFLVSLVTTHLPLREVADSITEEKIAQIVILSHEAAKKLGRNHPRIGVAGLNPHAGESGALGEEDALIIAPAVRKARRRKIDVVGPIPADVLFRAAYRGEFDVVVSMYHDQGLAPFKMVSFEHGVNVTFGLPFVRTSVDHGTAVDIAGKGVASETSMLEAIKLAARLAK
jgi:4-hydroxythreonine-4-phosphate dehydrogenase